MKRGLIAWNPTELPRATLDARIERLRKATAGLGAPAALVFADVWRSNTARALVNFMPFWSRSLLVVAADGDPVLICGHSPRVYPWVRTITIAELRPGGNLAGALLELVATRRWTRLAAVDRRELPWDIHSALAASGVELLDLPSKGIFDRADDVERAMRKTSVETTRRLVEDCLENAFGETEHALAGRLERALRREGMEDVVIWLSDGEARPRPASDCQTSARSSVVVASEYRGHWCHVARPLKGVLEARTRFDRDRNDASGSALDVYDLSGSHPFRALAPGTALEPGRIVALHARAENGRTYGDTCVARTETSADPL